MAEPNGDRPRLALTMGDVSGIGPEVIARLTGDAGCQLVVGDPAVLSRALELVGDDREVRIVASPEEAWDNPDDDQRLCCWNPSSVEVSTIPPASVDPRCGRAAADWLIAATHAALDGRVDAIVTAPLHKTALAAAGIAEPGHTEILARVCNRDSAAMMLYLPPGTTDDGPTRGLGVAHATLHTSIRSVPDLLTVETVNQPIQLLDGFLKRLGCPSPRIAVCALNPHAGENGLFGDEEQSIIGPAIDAAVDAGRNVTGPLPADTLMLRAVRGEFDGVVAMFHDQGHIAMKLVGFEAAVNVTLGLPILRTSPSHGTAFDIAWQGVAEPRGMQSAVETAIRLWKNGRHDA
ncbi:MAG: 4-hydroxythreonine-4-phosphate dehydrogenase PdxA [Planctomycetaceae bacterium]